MWSISCWTIRAERPFNLSIFCFHLLSRYFNLIVRYLSTFHLAPGTDKHHSSSLSVVSECSSISGLSIIIVLKSSSSRSLSKLTTTSLLFTQTWGAARPTQPFSGSFIYFIISFPNFSYFFISLSFISSEFSLKISLFIHVSTFNIILLLI